MGGRPVTVLSCGDSVEVLWTQHGGRWQSLLTNSIWSTRVQAGILGGRQVGALECHSFHSSGILPALVRLGDFKSEPKPVKAAPQ
eukprot:1354733-Amphidinium_carterae.1